MPKEIAQVRKQRATEILKRLQVAYPEAGCELQHWQTPMELAVAAILSAQNWIAGVLLYFYTVRAQILSAASVEIQRAVTWDFSTFDASDPNVRLGTVLIA